MNVIPAENIDKMVPAAESSLVAAHERMKLGRNEPCPCDSGRKYKKCCLHADEDLVRRAAAASQSRSRVAAEVRPDVFAPEMATAPSSDGVQRRSPATLRIRSGNAIASIW